MVLRSGNATLWWLAATALGMQTGMTPGQARARAETFRQVIAKGAELSIRGTLGLCESIDDPSDPLRPRGSEYWVRFTDGTVFVRTQSGRIIAASLPGPTDFGNTLGLPQHWVEDKALTQRQCEELIDRYNRAAGFTLPVQVITFERRPRVDPVLYQISAVPVFNGVPYAASEYQGFYQLEHTTGRGVDLDLQGLDVPPAPASLQPGINFEVARNAADEAVRRYRGWSATIETDPLHLCIWRPSNHQEKNWSVHGEFPREWLFENESEMTLGDQGRTMLAYEGTSRDLASWDPLRGSYRRFVHYVIGANDGRLLLVSRPLENTGFGAGAESKPSWEHIWKPLLDKPAQVFLGANRVWEGKAIAGKSVAKLASRPRDVTLRGSGITLRAQYYAMQKVLAVSLGKQTILATASPAFVKALAKVKR